MEPEVRLSWEGKHLKDGETYAAPALRRLEAYGDVSESNTKVNRLIVGDNIEVMSALREEGAGQFALIYFDPPFFTGADWQSDGQMPAFSDSWEGIGTYLQWLLDRLTLARDLLAETGCLYLHLNWRTAHYARLLLDEVFGPKCFQNEIIWCYREAINSRKRWNRKHDTLLFYSKSEEFTFNADAVLEAYSDSHIRKYRYRDERGAYRLMGRGITGSPLRSRRDLPQEYETQYPGLTYRHYLGEGTLPVDYWLIDIENQASQDRTGYPTQKPEALLTRIVLASTNAGDLVGDFCCGSGTTLKAAERLGRRWIGCDMGALAIHTTRKRLLEESSFAPFVVETVQKQEGVEEKVSDAFSLVEIEQGEEGWRLRLSKSALEWVDAWAVEWDGMRSEPDMSTAVFCPQWWGGKTRRSPELSMRSGVYIRRPRYCRVALRNASGATTFLSLKIDEE